MTNDDIKALIERLENVRGSFVIPIEAPDVFGWADEAAQALSLLLDVKVAADDLLWCTANPPTMDMATAKLKAKLHAVEDA